MKTLCVGFPRYCNKPPALGRKYCRDCWVAKCEVEREQAETIRSAQPRDRSWEYRSSKNVLSKVRWADTIRREVLLTWGRDCHLCGLPITEDDLSFDHLIPRSKGGTTNVNNLRAAHRLCNSARGSDPLGSAA